MFEIITRTDGNGSIDYIRGEINPDVVRFFVIPNPTFKFEKYVISSASDNGILITQNSDYIITQNDERIELSLSSEQTESTDNPLVLTLTNDINITAYFTVNVIHISAKANIAKGSVYVSNNDEYDTLTATICARPVAGYRFVKWSDGSEDNPRIVSINQSISIVAEYTKIAEDDTVYQYRCFVKDQLYMRDIPKAFMTVLSFTVRNDLVSKSNSEFNVLKLASNVNNGDVIVVYDPKGTTIYQGVINSIEGLTIRTSQMQSFYKGAWIYNTRNQTYLESEIKNLLQDYSQGEIYGSTYIDPLVAQRLGGIAIQSVNATQLKLPTKEETIDMEDFIYSLYEIYGIVFEFQINFSGENYLTIKKPTYQGIKISDNNNAISNISTITEIEEANRVIIFNNENVYRTTYIVKTDNTVVEEPASIVNRFNITNTEIVNSDDEIDTIIANSLPTTMYNHKISFNLRLKNFIYDFNDFVLSMPIYVWLGENYYDSVLTGWEFSKENNEKVYSVDMICGKVRTSLTKKLLRGV